MEISKIYSGTVEDTNVDIERLQDCSYNSFKKLLWSYSKCMKNGQFLNLRVSSKSSSSTEISETYCGNVEYHQYGDWKCYSYLRLKLVVMERLKYIKIWRKIILDWTKAVIRWDSTV